MTATPQSLLPKDWQPASFLVTGDSGAGKSATCAEMAKAIFKGTGGKIVGGKAVGGSRTRWYCLSDNWEPAIPLVDLGIIEVVDMRGVPQSPYWLPRIAQGWVAQVTGEREEKDGTVIPTGRFTKGDPTGIGLYVFDSLTGLSDNLMADYADYSKAGANIGGGGSYNYTVGSDDWGGTEKMGSNNQSHYGEAQRALLKFADRINQLAARTGAMVICTATVRRDATEGGQPLLGPQLAGKALTAEYPRKFTYAVRMARVATPGKAELEHELSMDSIIDLKAGGAMVIGNRRLPKTTGIPLPPVTYRPADLPKAYGDLVAVRVKAREAILKELA